VRRCACPRYVFAALVLLLGVHGGVEATDCASLLRTHRFATSAQLRCDFSRYSQEALNQARRCYDTLGEARTKENLLRGTTMFYDRVKKLGKAAACSEALETLPVAIAR